MTENETPLAAHYRIALAGHLLRKGAIVAYPTEAVYGLGCDPGRRESVQRLLSLKRRTAAKGLLLIAASLEQLGPWLDDLDPALLEGPLASWPGPATWLLPSSGSAPDWILGSHERIAVRVTAHPIARALCLSFGGPLVSTSANPAGLPPARSPLRVRKYFGDGVDLILHGRLGGQQRPTPIRDAVTGEWVRM